MHSFKERYQQAKNAVLVVCHPQPGIIRLAGQDRLSFLHRMSTNAIEGMPDASLRSTTLTTPLARVIDRLWLLSLGKEVWVLTSPGREERVEAWFNQHIFFNDDIEVTPISHHWSLWGAYGPQALSHVAQRLDVDPGSPPGHVAETQYGMLAGWSSPAGVRMLLNSKGEAKAAAQWPEGMSQEAAEVYEILRVEAGQPKFGAEFDEDSIPLEVGLRSTINFEKGCYTGQEIIARMEGHGQLARILVGLRLSEPAQPGRLETKSGQAAGRLSSCVNSPSLGWIGLGVVRTKLLEGQSRLYLADNRQPAEIVDLPFDSSG
jgi:aminomethyltransferase